MQKSRLTFTSCAAYTFIFDFVEFDIFWETYAYVVVPHIAVVTAEHVSSVFRLSTNAEKTAVLLRLKQVLFTADIHVDLLLNN